MTQDQVLALAPDASSAAAAKKLVSPGFWKNLGRGERAVWGECQGSSLYQVRVNTTDLTTKCSCPSRKFPCKHALGLLLLLSANPTAAPAAPEPEWVTGWLDKRKATEVQREAKKVSRKKEAPPDAEGEKKRSEKRLGRVRQGIDALDLWMGDLVRSGLAGLESQGAKFWEAQAARMVDSQLPGIASRLRRMAAIPGSRPDWPQVLLFELGRMALLTHAFRRLEELPTTLQADVRRLLGYTLTQEEVISSGEVVTDDWVVLGQWVDEEERLCVQRTWMRGEGSGRDALVLQFSVGAAPFTDIYVPGTRTKAELAYWPSAYPQRALVKQRMGPSAQVISLPGDPTVEAFIGRVAGALECQPWLDRFACCLNGVVPQIATDGRMVLLDVEMHEMPVRGGFHWTLLALSGGSPIDVAGEWDGEGLLPLGALAGGEFRPLWRPSQ